MGAIGIGVAHQAVAAALVAIAVAVVMVVVPQPDSNHTSAVEVVGHAGVPMDWHGGCSRGVTLPRSGPLGPKCHDRSAWSSTVRRRGGFLGWRQIAAGGESGAMVVDRVRAGRRMVPEPPVVAWVLSGIAALALAGRPMFDLVIESDPAVQAWATVFVSALRPAPLHEPQQQSKAARTARQSSAL